MSDKFLRMAEEIAAQGWSCCHDFLPRSVIAGLAREAQDLWQAGEFRKAGVGRSAGYTVRPDVRGDFIHWLDEKDLSPSGQSFWEEIKEFGAVLNRALFIGLVELEAHFAVFQPGTRYEAHVDRFSGSGERTISVVLYLNQEWGGEEGGELRIHPPDEIENPVDILPQAGTLVAFRSDIVRHEVLPAARARFSLTGWLRRPASNSTF